MEPRIVRDDIAAMKVDAIVLPANPYLKEGQGASANIFAKAGRDRLKAECMQYDRVEPGQTVPTRAFALPANCILHSVVPKWKGGEENERLLLSSCYLTALTMADNMSCKSIAFPLLASGNNGFDLGEAFDIALESIRSYNPTSLEEAILVLYGLNASVLARERGYQVEEHINQAYVLAHKKDQMVRTQFDALKDDAIEIAQGFANKAMHMAVTKLKDPNVQEAILAKAADVAKAAIAKKKGK